MPGQPGPSPEQLAAQANSLKLRLSIIEDRKTVLDNFVDIALGDDGADARNVLGNKFITGITAMAMSLSSEYAIEQDVLTQSVAQLEQMIARMRSPIVTPQFGVPRQ